MTAASADEENIIEQPRKVAPVTRPLSGVAPQFTHSFAGNSLTILRLKAK